MRFIVDMVYDRQLTRVLETTSPWSIAIPQLGHGICVDASIDVGGK